MQASKPNRPSRATNDDPRVVAMHCLREVHREEAFSNRVLGWRLDRAAHLEERDRGFVTTLVYGVLRHQGRLDHLIDHVAHGRRIRGELREILRIGAYELRELGHPPYAAISEAVRLGMALDARGGLRNVIHAVLSRIADEAPQLEATWEASSPLDALEKRWSIPRWWGGRWLRQLGPEQALARARALAQPPALELRVDLQRISREQAIERLRAENPDIHVEAVDTTDAGLRVQRGGDLFHTPLHEEGLVSVQSLAAQKPARLLDPAPGSRVLDACAGMGVKTIQIAEMMGRNGTVIAVDRDARKLEELSSALERGRIVPAMRVKTIAADLTDAFVPGVDDAGPFDAILLDAPCTGLGNVARHPEIRWNRRFQDIAELAAVQRRLLTRCLPLVAPGGRLAYAVCSLEPEEGPDVVEAVLRAVPGFAVQTHQWTPETNGTEGFFVAVLQAGPPLTPRSTAPPLTASSSDDS